MLTLSVILVNILGYSPPSAIARKDLLWEINNLYYKQRVVLSKYIQRLIKYKHLTKSWLRIPSVSDNINKQRNDLDRKCVHKFNLQYFNNDCHKDDRSATTIES